MSLYEASFTKLLLPLWISNNELNEIIESNQIKETEENTDTSLVVIEEELPTDNNGYLVETSYDKEIVVKLDYDYERYKNVIHENNMKKEKIKETYNVNDIFKNKKENKIIQNENVMEKNIVEYKKENIFKKFLNKILSFFNITKGDKI